MHFLHLQINSSDITIYQKPTHTGQYTHFSSFTPWSHKTAWIRALVNHAYQICSNQYMLQSELKNIQIFMSWNGFARNLTKKLIKAFTPHHDNNNTEHSGTTETATPDNLPKIWLQLPFIGKYGNTLTKRFKNKIRRLLKGPCKFISHWKTTQSNYFLSSPAKTKCRMSTGALLFTSFHVLVAKVHTLAKQSAAYTHDLQNTALVIAQKFMLTLIPARTSFTSNH